MLPEARFAEILGLHVHVQQEFNVDQAVDDLVSTINADSDSSRDDQLHALWSAIFDTALRAQAGTLVIARLQSLLRRIRQPFPHEIKPSLPANWFSGFGYMARDRFNFSPVSESPDLPVPPEKTLSWKNLNAFLSLLWTCADFSDEAFDFSIFAIWSLRDTLETSQSNEILSALLPGAAAWLNSKESSGKVFRCDKQWRAGNSGGTPARPGPLLNDFGISEDEANGFSMKRWHFGKKRFSQLSQQKDVDEEARKAALDALNQMNSVRVCCDFTCFRN